MNEFSHVIRQALQQELEHHIERLETKLVNVEARVSEFVPRRNITETVKRRHREAIKALGKRCPCCGINVVLTATDSVVQAEFDHFYSRERRAFEETWLICRTCHKDMADRTTHVAAFQAYQVRARQLIDGQQLALFDS